MINTSLKSTQITNMIMHPIADQTLKNDFRRKQFSFHLAKSMATNTEQDVKASSTPIQLAGTAETTHLKMYPSSVVTAWLFLRHHECHQ